MQHIYAYLPNHIQLQVPNCLKFSMWHQLQRKKGEAFDLGPFGFWCQNSSVRSLGHIFDCSVGLRLSLEHRQWLWEHYGTSYRVLWFCNRFSAMLCSLQNSKSLHCRARLDILHHVAKTCTDYSSIYSWFVSCLC